MQAAAISGRVTDMNEEPIIGAVITASADTGFGISLSDENGVYLIDGLCAGTYSVEVSADGYITQAIPGLTVERGQMIGGVNFSLSRSDTENIQESIHQNVPSIVKKIDTRQFIEATKNSPSLLTLDLEHNVSLGINWCRLLLPASMEQWCLLIEDPQPDPKEITLKPPRPPLECPCQDK